MPRPHRSPSRLSGPRGILCVVAAGVVLTSSACSNSTSPAGSTSAAADTSSTAAAANGTTTSSAPSTAASAGKLKKIVMVNPAPGQQTWQTVASCFTAEAKKKGVPSQVVGVPGVNTTTADELRLIQQAQADGASAIAATSFTDAASLEPAYKAARAKGIIISTMESGDATQARNFDVGLDIPRFGKDMATEIATYPGQHNVAIVIQTLSGTPKIFNDAFKAAIAGKSNMKLVQIVTDNGVVTKDADLVGSLLTAHPEITDIVAPNPGSDAGILTAIREHKLVGKAFLDGNSKIDPAKSSLDAGLGRFFYVQKLCDVGTLTVDNAIKAAAGTTVARSIPVSTDFATKRNFGQFGSEWQ